MIMLILACFVAFWFASSIPTVAQTLDSTKVDTAQKARVNWYWVHADAGPGFVFYPNGASGVAAKVGLGASVAFSHHLITLEGDFVLTGFINGIAVAGGMYGYILRNDWTFSSVSAGLAWVANPRTSTIGLLLEGQIAAKVPVIGLGLKLSANINALNPYGALSVVVPLGWMP